MLESITLMILSSEDTNGGQMQLLIASIVYWLLIVLTQCFILPPLRRVLVFPKGNNTDQLSMYLDVADASFLPMGWSRYAQFSLAVINQLDSKMSIRKGILPALTLIVHQM